MKERINIVDFHSHILPGADHGSDSLDTSLWQLNCAVNYGVSRIVATPHFYPHRHNLDTFVKRRDEAFMCLKEKMPKDVTVRLGAEAFICPRFEELPNIEKLFIYRDYRRRRQPLTRTEAVTLYCKSYALPATYADTRRGNLLDRYPYRA